MLDFAPRQIDNLVVMGDLHIMDEKDLWQEAGRNRIVFQAILEHAKDFNADLLSVGDLLDRRVVQGYQKNEVIPDVCKQVAAQLCAYCDDTRAQLHHVCGNHDTNPDITRALLPDVSIQSHGMAFEAYPSIEQTEGGILATHGHIFTPDFYEQFRRILDQEDVITKMEELINNDMDTSHMTDGAISKSIHLLFALLHQCNIGDTAERIVFNTIDVRRRLEQWRHQTRMDENHLTKYPKKKNTIGLVAELASALKKKLVILGHTHRPFLVKRKATNRKQSIIANPGGWLHSDRTRHFLHVSDATVTLYSVNQKGEIKEADVMQLAL